MAIFKRDKKAKKVRIKVLSGVSLSEDWVRPCPKCGWEQKIELRLSNGIIYDQPYCSACRRSEKKKNG